MCCCLLGEACRRTSPSGQEILSKDTMRVVLWEMFQADSYNETRSYKDTNYRHDTAYASLYLRIFNSHHLSREQFADSYDYYLSDPASMKEIIDSLNDKATRDLQKRGIFQSPYQHPVPMGQPPGMPGRPMPNGRPVLPNGGPTYPMGHPGTPPPRFMPGPHPPGLRPARPGQRPPTPGQRPSTPGPKPPPAGKPVKAILKPKSVV